MSEFLNSPFGAAFMVALLANAVGLGIFLGRQKNTLEIAKVNGKLITLGENFKMGYKEIMRRLAILESNTSKKKEE